MAASVAAASALTDSAASGKRPVLDSCALLELLAAHHIKPHHALTVQRALVSAPDPYSLRFADIAGLPRALPALLDAHFVPLVTSVEQVSHSGDSSTTKLLIRLPSGALVETVVMNYDRRHDSTKKPRYAGICVRVCACECWCIGCSADTHCAARLCASAARSDAKWRAASVQLARWASKATCRQSRFLSSLCMPTMCAESAMLCLWAWYVRVCVCVHAMVKQHEQRCSAKPGNN